MHPEVTAVGAVRAGRTVLLTLAAAQFPMTLDSSVMNVSTGPTAAAIIEENAAARLTRLRGALSVLAAIALVAMFFDRGVPTRPPGAETSRVDLSSDLPVGPPGARRPHLEHPGVQDRRGQAAGKVT